MLNSFLILHPLPAFCTLLIQPAPKTLIAKVETASRELVRLESALMGQLAMLVGVVLTVASVCGTSAQLC